MKLNSSYKYLFLDFETTGLDLNSDFPIQIALIQTDHHLKVMRSYTRYITLPESIKRLRSNVSYMTGIDIETIESQGQSLDTIQSEIEDFFGPDTILIGQNISFDIGFLEKFFPGCAFAYSIDTYPLAISTIPYIKSYSLESIDQYLVNKYTIYTDKKEYFLTTLSEGKTLSAHDALYDCIVGLCFIGRWYDQIERFSKQYPIILDILAKTSGEGIVTVIAKNEAIHNDASSGVKRSEIEGSSIREDKGSLDKVEIINQSSLPILISPLSSERKHLHETTIDRDQTPQHSKRSTRGADLSTIISQLPHPCIIAVSHGSKIDIIKRSCPDESFDYLKEEQIIDQEKLSLWLKKVSYTEEERLFVLFYLSHYRDGYRVLQPILTTHKHILDYLQIKKIELKKDKKILCSHGGLYYTIHNNPERKDIYRDYPICILDADRRHTTYNDYAQKGIGLTSILYQREKYEYELQQTIHHPDGNEANSNNFVGDIIAGHYDTIKTLINSLTFFIAHFIQESEKQYNSHRQYKREIDYLLQHQAYKESAGTRVALWNTREALIQEQKTIPQYLMEAMSKLSNLFQNPLKIQRNVNQNKDVYYSFTPAVRYIDFAEYLKMLGDHKVLFFSPNRNEYQTFLVGQHKTLLHLSSIEKIEDIITQISKISGSVAIVCHNADKSKKIFSALHQSEYKKSHLLIAEYLTGGVAKNASKTDNSKPRIIIGGYHTLLHNRGEGIHFEHIIITYVPSTIHQFIESDIKQYAQ